MSGYNNNPDSYEDLEDLGGSAGGSGLRKMLEESLAENKKLREMIEGEKRQATVNEVLRGAGLDPAVAELIPTGADPAQWIQEKGHLFGVRPPVDEEPEPVKQAVDDDPALVAEREAQEAMQAAREAGVPAVTQNDLDRLNSMSEADLLAEIQKSQVLGG